MSARLIQDEARTEAAAALALASGTQQARLFNPFWTQSDVFIDPSNSTGHASDNNDGKTELTPMRTWAAVLNRYGTISPILAQNTTWHFLSDQPDPASDDIIFSPYSTKGSTLGIQGSLVNTGISGVLAGVVPRNRATGQRWEANIGTPAAAQIGMILEDTTSGTRMFIDGSAGGNVAILTEPMLSEIAVLPVRPVFPTTAGTITSGDAFVLRRPIKINLASVTPQGLDSDLAGDLLYFIINQAWAQDPVNFGFSAFFLPNNVWLNECRIDRFVQIDNFETGIKGIFNNCWTAGSGAWASEQIFAGAMNTLAGFGPIAIDSGFDFDVLIHGPFNPTGAFANNLPATNIFGFVFCDTNINALAQQTILIETYELGGSALWGGCTLEAAFGGKVLVDTSATAQLLNSGGFLIDGTAFGNAFTRATGVWAAQVALTPVNIDAAAQNTLTNPATSSAIGRTHF